MYGLNETESQIIEKLLAGESITAICREYKIYRETIYRIRDRYNERKQLSEQNPELFKLAELLEFSRAYNTLIRRSDILTIPELVAMFNSKDIAPILQIGTLGKKSIEFIIDKLLVAGYTVSNEILEYIGRKSSNVIYISKIQETYIRKNINDFFAKVFENIGYYILYKLKICLSTILLTHENIEFLGRHEDEIQELLVRDCYNHISAKITDLIKIGGGKDVLNVSIIKTIDELLNNYIDISLEHLKDLYKSRVEE